MRILDLSVMKEAEELGLVLNASKSEIISRDMHTCSVLSLKPMQLVARSYHGNTFGFTTRIEVTLVSLEP